MVAPSKPRQAVREAQRDVTTLVIGAVMTIVSKVFEVDDAEMIAALTTLLTIFCHRASPDMASKR